MGFLFSNISMCGESATELAIGPKVLYAVGSQKSSAYPYFGAGFDYLHSSNGNDVNGTKFKVEAGVFIMPAQQQHLGFSIEVALHIDNEKIEYEDYWGDTVEVSESGTEIVLGVGLVGFVF
jgi:hypothetical protein